MKAIIVSPAAANSTLGNNVTASRWADILRQLGHHVDILFEWNGEDCDILIALHAERSHSSVERFWRAKSACPLVVALTGTDLYRDLAASADAQNSLRMATRIVALQSAALDILPEAARLKTSVIYQSAQPAASRPERLHNDFRVCVLSHLREVKDPLRAALAARVLPPESRIRIVHAGRALDSKWEALARSEERQNSRYSWLGDVPHEQAVELLASSDLFVLSSIMEGGANAIAEAVVCDTPIVCSDISGNIGMLGKQYPGYFRLRDTTDLSRLLAKAETDPAFLDQLRHSVESLQHRFSPEQELASWRELLATM